MRTILRTLATLEGKLGRRNPRPVVYVMQWPGGPDAIGPNDVGEYARMKRGGGPAVTNGERFAEAEARAAREGARLTVIQAVYVRTDGTHDEGHYVNDENGPNGMAYIHDDGTRTRYSWGDDEPSPRPL